MTEKTAQEELEILLPEVIYETTSTGEKVEIKRLKLRHLTGITKVVYPLMEVVKINIASSKDIENALANEGLGPHVLTALMTYPDEVLRVVGILTDRDEKWAGELDVDDAVRIILKIIEVNTDFFIEKVLPFVSQGMAALKTNLEARGKEAGQKPSSS